MESYGGLMFQAHPCSGFLESVSIRAAFRIYYPHLLKELTLATASAMQ